MRSQRRSLFAGVFIGLLVAAVVWIGREYVLKSNPPAERPTESVPGPLPQTADVANSSDQTGASVQLSEEEQKSIGVETVEVKRRPAEKFPPQSRRPGPPKLT